MSLKQSSQAILQEFRRFIARGNVIDMAVGVILGISFGKVIDVLVNQVIMPPLGYIIGGVDFQYLKITLKKATDTMPAVTLNFGLLINSLIDFFIVSIAAFMTIKIASSLYRKAPKTAHEKICPACKMTIPAAATRCSHCILDLKKNTECS